MKQRYRKFRRGWGVYHVFDNSNSHSKSLDTRNKQEAERLVHAMNEAERQPILNRQIARAYLMASDPGALTRTWQFVMDEKAKTVRDATLTRWQTAIRDRAFNLIRNLTLVETRPEHFKVVFETGTVASNVFLRKLHNFALDMNWLLGPVIPRRQWPKVRFKEKRGISLQEHQSILAAEQNPEWRAYYELLWHLGGSQSDTAALRAEDIDWTHRTLSYARMKTGSQVRLQFGEDVAVVFQSRPRSGCLFPHLATMLESDRAKAFIRRCKLAGVKGVSLHSYRYAWAERAKAVGFPERFAQQTLGQKSVAVHRAYAKKAEVRVPSLEEWEKQAKVLTPDFMKPAGLPQTASVPKLDTVAVNQK
jgi:integrase